MILGFCRFVIDTCRRLKEKKSYLIWNAVGCLGVSAVSELVKEVVSLTLHKLQTFIVFYRGIAV